MQMLMWVICFYLGLLFFLLVFVILKPDRNEHKSVLSHNFPPFSILISSRNEEKNVDRLLEMLSKQQLQPEHIVWVDDHSIDLTVKRINEWQKKLNNLTLIQLPSGVTGKRNAWKEGLKHVSTSLVLCIDADSVPLTEYWTISMLSSWSKELKILSGPVFGLKDKRGFSNWVYHEHAVVVLLGHILGILTLPIYISGANMLFRKEDFLPYLSCSKSLASGYGDDTLFMKYIIEKYGRKAIRFISGKNAVVQTELPEHLRNWISQRQRWLAKSTMFVFSYIFWLTLLVLTIDLSFFVFSFYFPIKGLFLLLIKTLLQSTILSISGKKFFELKLDFFILFKIMVVFGFIYFILSLCNVFSISCKN